jgi:hypothetical protein
MPQAVQPRDAGGQPPQQRVAAKVEGLQVSKPGQVLGEGGEAGAGQVEDLFDHGWVGRGGSLWQSIGGGWVGGSTTWLRQHSQM